MILGLQIEAALIDALSPASKAANLDQIHAAFTMNFVTFSVTSLAVPATWAMYSVFLCGWVIMLEGDSDPAKLFAANAFAFLPILIQSATVLTALLCFRIAHYSIFASPVAIDPARGDIDVFVAYVRDHPASLLIERTGYIAEVVLAGYLAANLIALRQLTKVRAIAGVVLCCAVAQLLRLTGQ